jgi:guanine nucleotide-binding protein G(i) subunit alpha
MGQCCLKGDRDKTEPLMKDYTSMVDEPSKSKQIKSPTSEPMSILLLGTGDSGKSTIFKQLQLIYETGKHEFPESMKVNFKSVIQKNVIDWMYELIKSAQKLELQFTKVSFA